MSESLAQRKRESVMLMARVTASDGPERNSRARDLSEHGVCIDHSDLSSGARVTIRLGQARPVAAECVWTRDGRAGLKFDAPIDVMLARKRAPDAAAGAGGAGWLAERDDVYRRSTRR